MALRTIFLQSEEILHKVSKPVAEFDEKLWKLLDDMADTMKHVDGVGLAAVQVGVLRRAVLIDVGDGVQEFINPTLLSQQGEVVDSEGCLSCPGEYGIVSRPETVCVTAQDRYGKTFSVEGSGLLARALCHEIDHLNGRIFKDIAIQMLNIDEVERKRKE